MMGNRAVSSMPRKAWAFLVRDFRAAASYRLAFVMSFIGIFFSVTIFFFISKLFGAGANPYLAAYGGNYFAFVLVGIALSGFLGTGLGAFAGSISSAQAQGTLEAMLVTPTKLSEIVLMSSVWNFVFTAVTVVVHIVFGVALFGLDLGRANVLPAALVLLLMVIVGSGLGIISASFTMVLKRGDPISWVFGAASSVMGGTFFPVEMFPAWLQKLSHLFPLFYGLRAMRLALIKGYGLGALAPDILSLSVFVAIIIPFSFWCFRHAVDRAKTDGSLATY